MSEQVKFRIIRETERALLIRQTTPNRETIETWVPRSQCDHISKGPIQPDGSRDGTLTMAEWLIDKHNLRSE